MQSIRLFITYLQISRYIGSSSVYSNLNRESKFMKKMISRSRKSKTKWYDSISTDLRSITKVNGISKPLSEHTIRRMNIRDKLFMEHITDQVSMGEVPDIVSANIEITHVKITPDFKYVNVFWIHSGDTCISVNEEALHQCAKIIRQRLSELRVIGVVPPIQFIENKQFVMTKEVDRKLAVINENLKSWSPYSEQTVDTLCINTMNRTSCDETEQTTHDSKMEELCVQLPVMRHDVLGLDHYKIMSRITNSLSKLKKVSQRQLVDIKTDIDNNSYHLKPKEVSSFLTQEEQQKIFSDFLTKRRIEEKRRYRMKQLHQQKLLNNSEEDIETDYKEYEDDNGDLLDDQNEFDEKE